jgi:hypothetical protein
MTSSATRGLWRWPLLLGLSMYLMALTVPDRQLMDIIREDGLVEYLGALAFLAASVLFAIGWKRSADDHGARSNSLIGKVRARNSWLLLLALAFFFAAGEEISWGQRVVGFATPDVLDSNVQDEVTLHNLPVFDPTNTSSFFHMNRLFTYFWFSFAIAVPLACRNVRVRALVHRLRLPIVPLTIGLQFLLFYLLSKSYSLFNIDGSKFDGRLVEVRETQHALLFATIALTVFASARDGSDTGAACRPSAGPPRDSAGESPRRTDV